MINWTETDPDGLGEPEYVQRECRTPKCQACGRFTPTLYPVWSKGWPTPEILFEVGNCCKELT